jgi:hypothetical protein
MVRSSPARTCADRRRTCRRTTSISVQSAPICCGSMNVGAADGSGRCADLPQPDPSLHRREPLRSATQGAAVPLPPGRTGRRSKPIGCSIMTWTAPTRAAPRRGVRRSPKPPASCRAGCGRSFRWHRLARPTIPMRRRCGCMVAICGRGGTGRRAGLKIQFWQQSVGSIPTARTSFSGLPNIQTADQTGGRTASRA